jgi:hypothetical protein
MPNFPGTRARTRSCCNYRYSLQVRTVIGGVLMQNGVVGHSGKQEKGQQELPVQV